MRRWLSHWVQCAPLIALIVAGCGGTGSTGGDETKNIATQFLDELRAGNYESAWQESSAEFKSLMGVQSLKDYVKTHPALSSPAEYVETRPIDRGGHTMAEQIFRATPPPIRGKPSEPATIRVLLASGDKGWKVEHLSVQ